MMETSSAPYYTKPGESLEQGDLLRVDIVAPAADEVQRIFRARDGRHGSVVFEEDCDGKVFSRSEIDTLLGSITRTSLHTKPFERTQDGQEEMVVVFSRLFSYFVIATQTCDICGRDKAPLQLATVLPIITLADFCRSEILPFMCTHENMTIEEFLGKHCEAASQIRKVSDIEYGVTVRPIVEELSQKAHSKNVRIDAKYLKNYLEKYYEKLHMFLLPEDREFNLPESYVDFTAAFTLPTSKLLTIRGHRFAKIAEPYRADFAQKFGNFFTRVALPRPMHPT